MRTSLMSSTGRKCSTRHASVSSPRVTLVSGEGCGVWGVGVKVHCVLHTSRAIAATGVSRSVSSSLARGFVEQGKTIVVRQRARQHVKQGKASRCRTADTNALPTPNP
jgi:hypothetical protein